MSIATFDDFMAAGKIEPKTIYVRGMEIKVKSLTAAESFEIQKIAEDLSKEPKEDLKFLLKKTMVSPAFSDEQLEKIMELDGKFITELQKEIVAALNPEDADALAEKN